MASAKQQKFTDPASAVRFLRFKGNVDPNPSKRSAPHKRVSKHLDTGWAHKNAVVFDKKLGVKRNTTIGGGNLFEDGPGRSSYVDSSRSVEFSTDLKGAVANSNRMRKNLMQMGSFNNKKTSKWEDDASFQDSGGMQGRIERAKKLMSQRSSITAAIDYLDSAIEFGLKECFHAQIESPILLESRKLRAQCYLLTAQYGEAEREAAKILVWEPYNETALLVRAEAFYLQCKFERALVIFWRGYRLRVPLYVESFRNGIAKTTNAISQSISVLDNDADLVIERARSFLPENMTIDMIDKMFLSGLGSDELSEEDKKLEAMTKSNIDRMKELDNNIDHWIKKGASTVMILAVKGPTMSTVYQKGVAFQPEENPRNKDKQKVAKSSISSDRVCRQDRDVQRLKSDEEFIDQLVDMFATEKEKHILSTAKNNGIINPICECIDNFFTFHMTLFWLVTNPDDTAVFKDRRRNGIFDRRIVGVASEVLDFIDGRKQFWSLQSNKNGQKAKSDL